MDKEAFTAPFYFQLGLEIWFIAIYFFFFFFYYLVSMKHCILVPLFVFSYFVLYIYFLIDPSGIGQSPYSAQQLLPRGSVSFRFIAIFYMSAVWEELWLQSSSPFAFSIYGVSGRKIQTLLAWQHAPYFNTTSGHLGEAGSGKITCSRHGHQKDAV